MSDTWVLKDMSLGISNLEQLEALDTDCRDTVDLARTHGIQIAAMSARGDAVAWEDESGRSLSPSQVIWCIGCAMIHVEHLIPARRAQLEGKPHDAI